MSCGRKVSGVFSTGAPLAIAYSWGAKIGSPACERPVCCAVMAGGPEAAAARPVREPEACLLAHMQMGTLRPRAAGALLKVTVSRAPWEAKDVH